VSKGAARVEAGRPRRYRPETPAGLVARISNNHGIALERLSSELEKIPATEEPTTVEIESSRGVLQLLIQAITKAAQAVGLVVPADAYPLLAPALRRPFAAGVRLSLWSTAPVELGFTDVGVISDPHGWPGMPIIGLFDQHSAIVAARNGSSVSGHWSSSPSFIAAARLSFERFTTES